MVVVLSQARKLSLESIHVPNVPDHVMVEGEGESRIVSRKVYVTEVSERAALDRR